MDEFPVIPQNKVKRSPHRGAYDRDTVYGILDAGFVCHVGFIDNGKPFVIPMSYGREGDAVYLHGASSARIVQLLSEGNSVCISVTHIDGIVVARSMFDTSVNYRSVVLFGNAGVVNEDERIAALKTISNHILPGRWEEVRQPNANELKATSILKVKFDVASAKIRSGPPDDDVRDLDLPVWAGVVPLAVAAHDPVSDPALRQHYPVSPSVSALVDRLKK